MGLLDEQPHKLEEYVALKFEMRNFEQKFCHAKESSKAMELQAQWEKYCAMEPVYEKARSPKLVQQPHRANLQAARLFGTYYYIFQPSTG